MLRIGGGNLETCRLDIYHNENILFQQWRLPSLQDIIL